MWLRGGVSSATHWFSNNLIYQQLPGVTRLGSANLRIKNYWCIHAITKFAAFQSRYPSKPELLIAMESFNEQFQASIKMQTFHSSIHQSTFMSTFLNPQARFWTCLQNLAIRSNEEFAPWHRSVGWLKGFLLSQNNSVIQTKYVYIICCY